MERINYELMLQKIEEVFGHLFEATFVIAGIEYTVGSIKDESILPFKERIFNVLSIAHKSISDCGIAMQEMKEMIEKILERKKHRGE